MLYFTTMAIIQFLNTETNAATSRRENQSNRFIKKRGSFETGLFLDDEIKIMSANALATSVDSHLATKVLTMQY